MEREKSATWKKCDMKKVKHEKLQHEKNVTRKKCNMEKVHMEKMQHGNSRDAAKTREYLKWE